MQHLASLCLTPKVNFRCLWQKIDQEQGCLALLESRTKNCIKLNTRNPEKKCPKCQSPLHFGYLILSRWNNLVGETEIKSLKLSQITWVCLSFQRKEEVPSAFVMCPVAVMVVIALLSNLICTLITLCSMWETWAKLFHLQLSRYKCRQNLSHFQIWRWVKAWSILHVGRGWVSWAWLAWRKEGSGKSYQCVETPDVR